MQCDERVSDSRKMPFALNTNECSFWRKDVDRER